MYVFRALLRFEILIGIGSLFGTLLVDLSKSGHGQFEEGRKHHRLPVSSSTCYMSLGAGT